MGRTKSRAVIALAALGLLAGAWGAWRLLAPEKTTPESAWRRLAGDRAGGDLNVILVTIDTLRADHLGCYGSPVDTPHLDQLAREGVLFKNTATTVPFTLPAHSSIMTGTYPPYHGVRENVGYSLDESVPTAAELLGAAGWATAGFVSAFVLDRRWGIARGFDHYFDDFEVGASPARQVNLGSVQRDGKETLAAALAWLDGVSEPGSPAAGAPAAGRPDPGAPDRPFFLWLHLFDPHEPYKPAEPYRSRYPRDPYAGEVAYTDALIGEFRESLEERGLLDTSLLIVTGDHGEGLGQHKESFHGFYLYETTVHVPLIVRPPFGELGGQVAGRRDAGPRVVEEAVSHVDLLPTVLAAVGLAVPEEAQGRSLLPLILGMEEEGGERVVYSESYYPLFHYGWAPLRTVRTASYKFIDAPRPELYHLSGDRREERNLFAEERRRARDLKERLEALTAAIDRPERSGAPGGVPRQPDLDEETLRQLRALGYVAGRGEVVDEEGSEARADPKDKIEIHQAIMWAQSFIGQGKEEEAEKRLLDAVERDPGMIDAHQMLGNIASQRGDFEPAAGHFQRALAIEPEHQPSLFGLADAYRRLGRLDEALVGFRRLQSLAPHDSKAALSMAEIHVGRGELEDALVVVAAAAVAEGAPALVHNRHGELLVLVGRQEEAFAELERALELNPQLAEARFNLAVLYEERGEVEQAIELYDQAIRRAPRHFQAQFNLGRLHAGRGEFDRAEELWRSAIESSPEFVRGHYFLAKLLMDRGELDRAEELARRGLEKDLEHLAGPLGHYVLADVLNRRGRRAEAQEMAEEGRRIQAAGGT